MDIKKELSIIQKQTELQRKDNYILVTLDNLKLKDITKEFVFELLQMLLGPENRFYSSLSIDNLTFIKSEKNDTHSIRYVYPWGCDLFQIFIWKDNGNNKALHLSVKLLT